MLNSQHTLIIGYLGRLARALAWRWPQARRIGRADLDITDREATVRTIEHLQPKIVINCAALTDLVRCEAEPDLAWRVNVRGVRNLAEGCKRVGATLVHFSSDYALNPVNEYAWTKRASEPLADLTIRAKIYDASHWAWAALSEGRSIRMVTNEYLNPISTTGLALMTEAIFLRGRRGLTLAGSLDRLSFWQVGRVWAEVLGVDPERVEPIEHLEAPLPRLAEMFLDVSPLLAAGISVPSLAEDARRHKEWSLTAGVVNMARGQCPWRKA